MKKSIILIAISLVAVVLLPGCSEQATTNKQPAFEQFSEIELLKSEPANALSVQDALKQVEAGKTVAVTGFITSKNSFEPDLALFSLSDQLVKSGKCTDADGNCIKSMLTALVQYKNKDNKVVKQTLKGFKGLDADKKVTVVGTIDKVSNAKSLVINLQAFYLE